MSLSDEERNAIVRLEIEKSKNTFAEVIALVNAGLWGGAANRLYYAVFHAVSALLVHDRHHMRYLDFIISKQESCLPNLAIYTASFRLCGKIVTATAFTM